MSELETKKRKQTDEFDEFDELDPEPALTYEDTLVTLELWKVMRMHRRCLVYAKSNIEQGREILSKAATNPEILNNVAHGLIHQMREAVYESKYGIETLQKKKPLWCERNRFEVQDCVRMIEWCLREDEITTPTNKQ